VSGIADESRRLGPFAPALALLAVSVLVNYVDRGNLSIAAPILKDELRISASQLGILFSAFFWSYAALLFVSGWLVDRFDVNLVIAVGYLVWSLATATTGLVHGFALLLVMRLILGVGESVAFPACSKILALHLPESSRGFANGIIIAGLKCGPAVGTLGAGLLITKYGWRPAFVGIGLVSLAWLPAWMKWQPRGERLGVPDKSRGPSFTDILGQRSFWGTAAGHFCGNYLLYFLITWLPFYLVRERGLSMGTMIKITSVYYLVDATSAIGTGWLSDFWIRNGGTATLVRKSAMAIGYTTAAIALAACAMAGPRAYLGWLMVTGVGCGMGGSGTYAFSQTLAGPRAAGRWTGLQNGIANLAGVVGPALTGFLVDRTGNFSVALAITAAVSVAAALLWVLAIGQLEPIRWTQERGGPSLTSSGVA
jgi:MFS transporter, ACS family, D-galactonate transporter